MLKIYFTDAVMVYLVVVVINCIFGFLLQAICKVNLCFPKGYINPSYY